MAVALSSSFSGELRYARVARYWGRKVYGAAQYVFSHVIPDVYKRVVLDPFGGAGSIAIEALKRGARVVYIDLNPYAYLITRVLIEWFDTDKLRRLVEDVLSRKRLVYKDSRGLKRFIDRDKLYSVEVNGSRKRVEYYLWDGDRCLAATVDGEYVECSDFDGKPY